MQQNEEAGKVDGLPFTLRPQDYGRGYIDTASSSKKEIVSISSFSEETQYDVREE